MTTSGTEFVAFRRALTRARPALARELPWRGHGDPWAILVSEVMLQQTSVARVREPWRRFLDAFPTPADCARAPLDEVLVAWRGLGYPRRASYLRLAAIAIVERHEGQVPATLPELRALAGVGAYTAAAVASFAFAAPVTVLDTNVGRVLARALANRTLGAGEARDLAERVRGRSASAAFNQSLLDLGAQFCRARPRCAACPLARACRWRREGGPDPAPTSAGVSRAQAPYAGSNRELRGRILAVLEARPRRADFEAHFAEVDPARLATALEGLASDGLVDATRLRLASR